LEPVERMALMESRDQFLSSHRDINIETRHFRSQEELEDQFEAASLAGAGPQLLLIDFDGVNRLAPSNVVKEIVEEVDYAFVLEGLKEISSHNGRNYIVPFRAYDFLMLFYNKELMNNVPWDFEGVFSYVQQVEQEEGEEEQFGFLLNEGEADWVIPFIGGYGGWIIDYTSNSLTLDTPAMQRTLEFIDYAYNQAGLLQGGLEYGEINELFKNGAAHMIIDNYSTVGEYIEAGIDLGLAKIPRVWEGTRYPTPNISGLGFMININTYEKQLEAAREFISFMISEEIQTAWNSNTTTLPVLADLARSDDIKNDSLLKAAFDQAGICRGKPYDQILMVIRNSINDNVESMLAGDISPQDAALKIQEDAIRLRSGTIPLEEKSAEEVQDENGDEEKQSPDTGQ
jgi:maltose/maltodextrin transport system substrate-binding protein